MQPVIVTTTTASIEEAEKIAAALVLGKLAACVNILGPIKSIYIWQENLVNETEYKLFIKTFKRNWKKIKKSIKENHSYSVPEISLIKVSDVLPEYKTWMQTVIAKK